MASEDVDLSICEQGIATITLNRPQKHNAFNADIISRLSEIFENLATKSGEVRVVCLQGAGKSFSAGADLEWMKSAAGWTHDENRDDALGLAHMLQRLYKLPQMTLALVHGAAIGGGAGLVAACDVGVAVQDTQFCFSEVKLGLTPATISPFVVRAIGERYARALFVTAEGFDGNFAHQMGLVHYVVETHDELEGMKTYLLNLALNAAPGAVADSKSLVSMVANAEIDDALALKTASQIAERRISDEGREGVEAFLNKRKASWVKSVS